MLSVAQQIIDTGLCLLDADLLTGTAGNISARCSDGEGVLITPSARDYRSLTERDLVWLHLASAQAEGRWKPSSEWRLHVAIYRARRDVNAVIHHHGTWTSMVAVARKTIPVLIDEAADIGPIPTALYGPSSSAELAEAVAGEFTKGSNAVLLANHGAVAVGQDLDEAIDRALQVERLAKIYIGAEVLGGAYPLDEAAIIRNQTFLQNYRAARAENQKASPNTHMPRIAGRVSMYDLVNYSFRAGVTFASLVHTLVSQRLHR